MRTFKVVDDKKHPVTTIIFETFAEADKVMQMLGGDGLSIVDDAGSRFVWNEERGQFDLTVGAAALAELLAGCAPGISKVKVLKDEEVMGLGKNGWVFLGSYRPLMCYEVVVSETFPDPEEHLVSLMRRGQSLRLEGGEIVAIRRESVLH
jgi:hypothetical protein